MPERDTGGGAREPRDGPAIVGLDHVLLSMPRGAEDAARGFYGDLLGLAEIAKPTPLERNGGCWFVGPGVLPGVAAGVSIHMGVEEPFQPARKAHVALLIDELEAMRAVLAAAGVGIVEDEAIDVRRFYAFDPFGNRLELIDVTDQGFSARGRYTERDEAGPGFAIEADLAVAPGTDPAAIGAAITVELCGHWEHPGPCHWPHHTAIERVEAQRVTVRTVAAVRPYEDFVVEGRIRWALTEGGAKGRPAPAWRLVRADRVALRPDEAELGARIARPPTG